jgi:hypothetical protein
MFFFPVRLATWQKLGICPLNCNLFRCAGFLVYSEEQRTHSEQSADDPTVQ